MEKIVEKIKNGGKALLQTAGDEIFLIERIENTYCLTKCWMGEVGWEYSDLREFELGEEKLLERYMSIISDADEWEVTMPVPPMK